MPRKPRSRPVAAHIADQPAVITAGTPEHQPAAEAVQAVVQQVADSFALPGDAAGPVGPADTGFAPEPGPHRPGPAFNPTDHGPGATDPATRALLRGAGFHAPEPAPLPEPPSPGPRPNMVWARIEGTPDRPVGIKLEVEQERRPGIAHPRTLIRFRDDLLPTPAEKQELKDNGFKFCDDVMAWGRQKSAASLEVARRLVSELARGRGDEGCQLYI